MLAIGVIGWRMLSGSARPIVSQPSTDVAIVSTTLNASTPSQRAHPDDANCISCHDVGHITSAHRITNSNGDCLECHDMKSASSRSLLIGGSVASACNRCHATTQGHDTHSPYAQGQCTTCHEPHASPTPALLRGGTEAAHCATCHEPHAQFMAAQAHSHNEVRGACLACHSPHASDWAGLLRNEPRAGCVACHEPVGVEVATSVVSHDAVLTGDQCISCHEPHAAGDPMMLLTDQTSVCLKCHSKEVTAHDGRTISEMATLLSTAPVVHGAVASGNCAACHSVHGGNHAKLLNLMSPETLVGGFDIRNYALCFSCHDPNLVLSESALATQFRDGDRNLHRVHVQGGERSRSCGTCHEVHAGTLPRLIASTVRYEGSTWEAPMGFELLPDGGRCASACHEPLQYRRATGNGGTP